MFNTIKKVAMRKMIIAVVALFAMLAAVENLQARQRGGKHQPSVEQIAQMRSERQAACMHLNQAQMTKLYKLNLREAKYMQRYQRRMCNYKADLMKIVGVENMKMYEANRMRNRGELQRPPRKGNGHQCSPCVKPQRCPQPPCSKGPRCGNAFGPRK
jgi:hypothetical protein